MMAAREEAVVRSLVQKIEGSHDGCSLLDILSDIDHLCQASQSPERKDGDNFPDRITTASITNASRPSPDRIWELLTQDPRISIGQQRQFNTLTLADLWDHHVAALARIYFVAKLITPEDTKLMTASSPLQQQISPIHQPRDTLPEESDGAARDSRSDYGVANINGQTGSMDSIEPGSPAFDRIRAAGFEGKTRLALQDHAPGFVIENGSVAHTQPRSSAESNTFGSPSRTDQQPPDDTMVSAAITQPDPNTSQSQREPSSQRSQKQLERQHGRRKYLQGTEGFWNEMFWHARNQCEGQITRRFTAGIATHPGARALFANRPTGIDQVLLDALEADLPLPADPQDITESWRDSMKWVLDRYANGIYISPEGVRRVNHSTQHANHSSSPRCQIMILKSSRLQEVDFTKIGAPSTTHSLPDSVANGFRRQPFVSSQPTSITGTFGPRPPIRNTDKNISFLDSVALPEPPRGPPLGVFSNLENRTTGLTTPSKSMGDEPKALSRGARKRKAGEVEDIHSPMGSTISNTTISLESPELAEDQPTIPETISDRGLPPPLMTRGRKRKLSKSAPPSDRSPKLRKPDNIATRVDATTQVTSIISKETAAEALTGAIHVAVNLLDGPMLEFSASTSTVAEPKPKRTRVGKDVRKEVVKQLLLDVIDSCGGIVPNDYLCISDYVIAKHKADEVPGTLDAKFCKEVMKSLCSSGKLKKLTFTFQKKSGATGNSTILANVSVDATSEAVKRLQQNIINALPNLYVPPLGSVLDAPAIVASLNTTISSSRRSLAGKIPTQKGSISPHRRRCKFRKDILGASPARRPFTLSGASTLIQVQGLEDELALTFAYVAIARTEAGQILRLNAAVNPNKERRSTGRQSSAIPKFQARARVSNSSAKITSRKHGRAVTSLANDPTEQDESTHEATGSTSTSAFGRSSRGRKIIWKNRDSDVLPPSLPSSLQDVLDMPGQIPKIDYSMTEDPLTNRFYWELDAVEYWEINILKIYQQQASDWTFINHCVGEQTSPPPAPEPYPELRWKDPIIHALPTPSVCPTYSTRQPPTSRPRPPLASFEQSEDESIGSDYSPDVIEHAPSTKKRRRRSSSHALQDADSSKESRPKKKSSRRPSKRAKQNDGQPLERKPRPRILQNMPTEEVYRIVIAVIVVRVLAGGPESDIDWSIVQKLCPSRDQEFLADRWSTLIIRNRQDIASLTESLQRKYIPACESGHVPWINFDDVQNSDWEAIVLWAEQNLDKNLSDNLDTLPGTKAELLQTMTLTFDEPQTLREALAFTGQQSIAMKEEILANTPSAVPREKPSESDIRFRIQSEVEEEDYNLSLAKSWAVATIMTEKDSLSAAVVAEKLSTIAPNRAEADKLFAQAIKSLQRNQIIKRPTKSTCQLSDRWPELFDLKRMITAPMLRAAALYKRDVLDPAALALPQQEIQIPKTQILQDGTMLALINLTAAGRCRVAAGPAGLPAARYGLDPHATNYSTKGLGRLLTLFATTVRPTDTYLPGDPMAEQRRAIPTWRDGGKGRIPCWVDVNGTVLREVWEMVVCAVVGLVSGRPGISAREVERTLGHGVAGWEVEVLLEWLEGSGFVRRTGPGTGTRWETREWWWLVCGFPS